MAHYIAAHCADPKCAHQVGVAIALEFVLPDSTSLFVKAEWDGHQTEGWLVQFKVQFNGSSRLEEAVLSSLRIPRDGPTLSYEEHVRRNTASPRQFVSRSIFPRQPVDVTECGGAVAKHAYCYGETYASLFMDPEREYVESLCVPEDAKVLDALTEKHFRQLRFCGNRFVAARPGNQGI